MSDLLVMEPNLWADFNPKKKKMVSLIPFFAIWAFIVDWIDSMGLSSFVGSLVYDMWV